jgi:hypothetical protein
MAIRGIEMMAVALWSGDTHIPPQLHPRSVDKVPLHARNKVPEPETDQIEQKQAS